MAKKDIELDLLRREADLLGEHPIGVYIRFLFDYYGGAIGELPSSERGSITKAQKRRTREHWNTGTEVENAHYHHWMVMASVLAAWGVPVEIINAPEHMIIVDVDTHQKHHEDAAKIYLKYLEQPEIKALPNVYRTVKKLAEGNSKAWKFIRGAKHKGFEKHWNFLRNFSLIYYEKYCERVGELEMMSLCEEVINDGLFDAFRGGKFDEFEILQLATIAFMGGMKLDQIPSYLADEYLHLFMLGSVPSRHLPRSLNKTWKEEGPGPAAYRTITRYLGYDTLPVAILPTNVINGYTFNSGHLPLNAIDELSARELAMFKIATGVDLLKADFSGLSEDIRIKDAMLQIVGTRHVRSLWEVWDHFHPTY